MRPRSGLAAKHGVTVLNSPGTVDADYRGEINVLLINLGNAPFTIRRGERIAQMVIAPVTRAELVRAAFALGDRHAAAADSVRPGARAHPIANSIFKKSSRKCRGRAFFPSPDFRSRSGLLPARLRLEDIVGRFANGERLPVVSSCGFGANHVGRDRGDASDLAVVHLAGARRHRRRWRGSARRHIARMGHEPGLSERLIQTFSISAGRICCAGDGAGRARLLGGRRYPADAHAHPRRHERAAAAHRNPRTSIGSRPLSRAAVRRTAGFDFLGRGRGPSADQRRHRAAVAAGCNNSLSAFWRSEPGCRRNRRCRWIMRSMRCAMLATVFCSI